MLFYILSISVQLTDTESVLKDYELAIGDANWSEVLIKVKVEAFLFIVLSLLKKKDFPTGIGAPFNSLHWQLDVPFTYKPVRNKRLRETITPHGELGHVLFYGSRDDLDTNLVVVITQCAQTGWGTYHAQAHTSKLSVRATVTLYLTVSRLMLYFSDTG
jgi:hypothetical protein